MSFRSLQKWFTTRGPSSHTRNSWIRLAPIVQNSPTAASRRSLGRVSVPVWLVVLSDQLLIVAFGEPLPHQPANQSSAAPLARGPCGSPSFFRRTHAVLANLSAGCPPRADTFRCITHPFATRRRGEQAPPHVTVRLACVKRSASVQSELRIKLYCLISVVARITLAWCLTEYFLLLHLQ